MEGCACGGAQGGGRMGGCASRRSASKLGARAGTGHVHRSRSHWPHPALQAFYPWPADKLDLIGGSRRAYIQENVSTDPRTRPLRASLATCTKAGRRGGRHVEPCIPNRAAHPCMQDGNGAAGQDGWSEQSAAERGAERLRRCLDAFADWPPHVRGEGGTGKVQRRGGESSDGRSSRGNPDCATECRGRGRRQLAATPAAAACSSASTHPVPPSPSAELLATTDPLAITEHGQFFRDPDTCQVSQLCRARLPAGPGTLVARARPAHQGTCRTGHVGCSRSRCRRHPGPCCCCSSAVAAEHERAGAPRAGGAASAQVRPPRASLWAPRRRMRAGA